MQQDDSIHGMTDTDTAAIDVAAEVEVDTGLNDDAEEKMTLPLEFIDQCIGRMVRVYLRDHHYYEAKLLGFDDLVNLVLEDAKEFCEDQETVVPNVKKMLISSRNITIISLIDDE